MNFLWTSGTKGLRLYDKTSHEGRSKALELALNDYFTITEKISGVNYKNQTKPYRKKAGIYAWIFIC